MYKNEAWNDAIGLHKAPKTYEGRRKSKSSSSSQPLKGDVIFVDVPGSKGGDELRQTLSDLGARVVKSGKASTLSHVVFRGGAPSTLALLDAKPGVFGVTPAWVDECKATGTRVNEMDFNFSSASSKSSSSSSKSVSSSTNAKKSSAKRKKVNPKDKENAPDELNSQQNARDDDDDEVSDFDMSADEVVPKKSKKRAKLSPAAAAPAVKPTSKPKSKSKDKASAAQLSKPSSSKTAVKKSKKEKSSSSSSATTSAAKKSPKSVPKPKKETEKTKPTKKTPKDSKAKKPVSSSGSKSSKKDSSSEKVSDSTSSAEKSSATKKKRDTGPPKPAKIKRRKFDGAKSNSKSKASKSDDKASGDSKQKKRKKPAKKKKAEEWMSDEESDHFVEDDLEDEEVADDVSDEEAVDDDDDGEGPGLAFSKLEASTTDIMFTALKKFKRFRAAFEPTDKFSHLVIERKVRTLKVLFAIAHGSWVLTQEWLCASVEAGKWVAEEKFEFEDFSGCRKSRLAHAKPGHKGLLDGLKVHIAVVDDPSNPVVYDPPLDTVKDLITASGGKVCYDYFKSDVCIAHPQLVPDDTRVPIVSQEWLLASLVDYEVKPYDEFVHETIHSQVSAAAAGGVVDNTFDEPMANSDNEDEGDDEDGDDDRRRRERSPSPTFP